MKETIAGCAAIEMVKPQKVEEEHAAETREFVVAYVIDREDALVLLKISQA